MARIYIASSWKNNFIDEAASFLMKSGHEVFDFRNPNGNSKYSFSWSNIDPNWKSWDMKQYQEGLKHPFAENGFKMDFEAMNWADVCLLILPSGRSAHTEAGWMKGVGKRVFVYSPKPEEPELMYKIYDLVSDSLIRINEAINESIKTLIIYNNPDSEILFGIVNGDYSHLNGAKINIENTEKEDKALELLFDDEGMFKVNLFKNILIAQSKDWDKIALIEFA